jgi:hypothetical protein
MVNALAVSTLLYGSVIFSCLSATNVSLEGGTTMFKRAEVLFRKMLRWAVRSTDMDTRCSFLYVLTNSTNV